MGFDILLCIICGGFMCICSGFGTYGCYRCFTDKGESRSRVHSEYTIRNAPKKQKLKGSSISSASSSSTVLSSFNGTIYSINSQDSFGNFTSNDGTTASNQTQKWGFQNLKDKHDFAVSINPKLVHYDIKQNPNEKKKVRQVHTAP